MPTPTVTIEWMECPELPQEPSVLARMTSGISRLLGNDTEDPQASLDDDPWQLSRVLYVYFDPDDWEPLYVGKAWATTVYQRWAAKDKDEFIEAVQDELDLREEDVVVMAGVPSLPPGKRLTSPLLKDMESLLIAQLRPSWNKQNRVSRLSRPGMVLRCEGNWPLHLRTFVDD